MTTDLFLTAARKKLRYPSAKGLLDTEMLFDLPLTSKSGMDLDTIAKNINAELKTQQEESFVSTSANPRKGELELQLEIVKTIIGVKLADQEAARNRLARATERNLLEEALLSKKNEALRGMSLEDLEKRLAQLRAES